MFNKKPSKNIHLDFAATTPVDPFVLKKMQKFYLLDFFNPSSIYSEGRKVKEIINNYKNKIAKLLQVKSSEIIFTNGGTESINIAILGLVKNELKNNTKDKGHIISTKIEHPAVLETLKEAEILGFEVTYLDVETTGQISLDNFRKSLRLDTKLVTIGYVSSETGVIQPIKKISREILKFKESVGRTDEMFPFFHVDSSQAALTEDLNLNSLKADMMTLDGSKIYGPKGAGVLIKRNYIDLMPIMFGGGQEQGIRPGTENVSGVVGFSEALFLALKKKEKTKKHFENLQEYMLLKIEKEIPEARLNGNLKNKVPQILNFCITGPNSYNFNSEFAVIMMDEKGVNCSQMTACKSNSGTGQSYVIENISGKNCASSSIRFSFGLSTNKKNIDKAIMTLKDVILFQFKK